MSDYRSVGVAVNGGMLRVGVWEPPGLVDPPTVLLVHGVTASHLAWSWVADALPGHRLIAPDLRGRGASRELPGPVGMAAHANDLAAVLDALGAGGVTVVGHSMGAFVALVLGDLHPGHVTRLILVDGGLPLDLPEGAPEDVVREVLGPTARRLDLSFPSVEAYLDFWRQHPAFSHDWTTDVEHYFAHDLVGRPPDLRAATRWRTVLDDSVDQNGGSAVRDARERMRHPTLLLTAERGFLDDLPPLYEGRRLAGLLDALPRCRHRRVARTNHYTIVMSARGAGAVAQAIAEDALSSSGAS